MNKLNLESSFTKNVVQELERLTSQFSDNHTTLGLAYVDVVYNGESRKGWRFNVFGNEANYSGCQYIEIENYTVVVLNLKQIEVIKSKRLDLLNGWLVPIDE